VKPEALGLKVVNEKRVKEKRVKEKSGECQVHIYLFCNRVDTQN
jgi:hypothetical protein